jgi:signal transduction histidine kinase
MLDMSQLSTKDQTVLTQTQFNIVENFAQVLISLERKINDRHLDVDAQFPDNDVMVWGEPDDITQVCYNLMDNAIKFAKEGTAIGVSIVPQGNKAYISVRNVGETIPPDELNLVFDRFHKSDRSRSLDKDGVGLGLYIVKTILNRHKETITVTSQNGLTEFQFTLTLAE